MVIITVPEGATEGMIEGTATAEIPGQGMTGAHPGIGEATTTSSQDGAKTSSYPLTKLLHQYMYVFTSLSEASLGLALVQ